MDTQILITILPVILLIFVLLAFFLIKPKKAAWKNKALANLSDLENRIQSGDTLHLKSALVDADKLLDFVMKSRRLKGETMGERLKNANKYFDRNQYNRIWEAHKLRNRLVHEIDSSTNDQQIRTAFSELKSAIRKLS